MRTAPAAPSARARASLRPSASIDAVARFVSRTSGVTTTVARSPSRSSRQTADNERKPLERGSSKLVDDRDPGDVELARGRGRAASGDAIRLLDERDAHALGVRCVGRRDEVACSDAASGTVPEHEPGTWLVRRMQVDAGRPVRGLDVTHRGRGCFPRRGSARPRPGRLRRPHGRTARRASCRRGRRAGRSRTCPSGSGRRSRGAGA